MRLFLILLAVPIIEIALFIELGGLIGTWPTVGIVILTALVGSIMLRRQGLAALANAQQRLAQGEAPGQLLADGVMIVFAGALLLTPGFFTDAVGFLLLIPGVRVWLFGFIVRNIKFDKVEVKMSGPGGTQQGTWEDLRGGRPRGGRAHETGQGDVGGQTVDGVFEDVTPDEDRDRSGRDNPPPLR
ncbi:MAG: FxsA family protein [Paracoccaceae bacterium]